MKKKRSSLFLKIVLIMLPLALILEGAMLFFSFNIIYDNNLKSSEKNLKNAVMAAVQYCETCNMYEEGGKVQQQGDFDLLCEMFDATYIYAVKPDLETKDETYLAIGFGEYATDEAKETRYPGVMVHGTLNDEEIKAYNGITDGVILHERNQFGDDLVCYASLTRYFDTSLGKYVVYEVPVIIGAEISLDMVNRSFQGRFQLIAMLTMLVTVFMMVIFAAILFFRVSKPIRLISSRMGSFITDREKGIEKLPVRGNDELTQMADAFNTMTDEIDSYINDIEALNREKHTQEAELNIARRIQMGLLNPDRTDTDSAEIRAYMLAAKDVGGDLYDYYFADDGRVYVAIADVSGKGISAALFMARAITLLHQYARMGHTPAQMLGEYNDTMTRHNPGRMFITTFIAVWDPVAGTLTYSNAGHNPPYILSDRLIMLEGGHGVAAGLFAGEKYEDAVIGLKPGDTLFLFTDGVNEAKNSDDSFYSTERLEQQLRACIESGSTDITADILSDLNSFASGAAQNDDVTMLSLRIKPLPDERVLKLTSETSQLAKIKEAVFALDIDEELKAKVYVAAEEMFVNICSYAYPEPGEVEVAIASGERIRLTFTDSGKPFDPTAELLDISTYDHTNSVGGLGRFLTFSFADEHSYEYRDGKNILTLFFKRSE